MKKNLLFVAFAGALLAGCSTSDVETSYEQEVLANSQVPVTFGTYVGNAATTRTLYDATNKPETFGVFGYYSGTSKLTNAGDFEANFMYNQTLTESSGNYTYNPVKYWPNGNSVGSKQAGGGADGSTQYLSFFAYAPVASNVVVQSTYASSKKGAPIVTYTFNNSNPVDLMYGTAGSTDNTLDNSSQNNTNDQKLSEGGITDTYYNINLTKQTTTGKVKFNFHHALALINAVEIVADPEVALGETTKISVSSVSLTFSPKYNSGDLNIVTGAWSSQQDATESEKYTATYNNSDVINENLFHADTSSSAFDALPSGVTATAADLLKSTATKPVWLFIPGEGNSLSATITYTVRTKDNNLKNSKYSEVTQTITNSGTISNLSAGTAYKVTLSIGLNTVKFAVDTVDGWTTGTNTANIYFPASN